MFKENLSIEWLIKDKGAQIFSIDALMAIILITIVIGMSADAVDIAGFKITDYSAGKSLDRIATDAAEILVNTPGSPDWENSNSTLFVTPGLAEDNNGSKNTTKTLSVKKIYQLKARYSQLIANIIPRGGGSSLIIYPINSTLQPVEVNNETPPQDVSVVAGVNRSVLVNFKDFKILASINTFNGYLDNTSENSAEICPHYNLDGVVEHQKPTYNSNTPGWNCRHFKITQQDLNTTDFYILTDPILNDGSARWVLDRPDNISEAQQNFNAQPVQVNARICEIIGDDKEALLWLHVLSSGDTSKSFNIYLVGVPKGTSPENVKVEYLNPHPCFFVFKIWL